MADIDKEPLKFVQITASFSYLSPIDLGWDPTCMVWNAEEQITQPSYKVPQKVFQQCGVYDLPWVFRVEKEDYVIIGPAKVYVLKQCWQRLPGLGSTPKAAEMRNGDSYTPDQVDRDLLVSEFGDINCKPFEVLAMERAGWKERIKASWNVELNGEPITTFKTICKNLATSIPSASSRSSTPSSGDFEWDNLQMTGDAPVLVTRTLVRLVFDRPGWPIARFRSKLELLSSLKSIVTELETLYENGVVHRDVSPSNLIISDSGGHIIDYDYSQIAFVTDKAVLEKVETKNVVEIATKILKNERRLWGVEDRSATHEDYGWPEEIGAVYLFGRRQLEDGFVVGTYEFVSHNLPDAPYHHGGHDLGSRWWSINILPLTLEGPGGKKRKDPPLTVINDYYTGGPGNKTRLWVNCMFGGNYFDVMMAKYVDYFEDLKPFMMKWASFLHIALYFESYEHYHPHRYLIKIIDEAIQEMQGKEETGYEKATKEEDAGREKEKVDMAEAICKQITIPILLKLKGMVVLQVEETPTGNLLPDTVHSEPSTATKTLSPEHNTISLTTVDSPERDRAVKRARAGIYIRDARD